MSASRIAQDPNELFDIVRGDGSPLGFAKPRAEVHRDGDWHRAVHVWVYGSRDYGPFMLFQRRSRLKDTMPGMLDPTVGGHYGAGERLEDVLREVEEELGVPADRASMRHVGVRVCAGESEPGILDRELQDVFLWRRDDPLGSYRPNPIELDALVEIPLAGALAIYSGEGSACSAFSLGAADLEITAVDIGTADLRRRIDQYGYRVAVAIGAALRGDAHVVV